MELRPTGALYLLPTSGHLTENTHSCYEIQSVFLPVDGVSEAAKTICKEYDSVCGCDSNPHSQFRFGSDEQNLICDFSVIPSLKFQLLNIVTFTRKTTIL